MYTSEINGHSLCTNEILLIDLNASVMADVQLRN